MEGNYLQGLAVQAGAFGNAQGRLLAALQGQGHLTRINDILSNLMEAERRIGAGR
jgi:hypothetical protein